MDKKCIWKSSRNTCNAIGILKKNKTKENLYSPIFYKLKNKTKFKPMTILKITYQDANERLRELYFR